MTFTWKQYRDNNLRAISQGLNALTGGPVTTEDNTGALVTSTAGALGCQLRSRVCAGQACRSVHRI